MNVVMKVNYHGELSNKFQTTHNCKKYFRTQNDIFRQKKITPLFILNVCYVIY